MQVLNNRIAFVRYRIVAFQFIPLYVSFLDTVRLIIIHCIRQIHKSEKMALKNARRQMRAIPEGIIRALVIYQVYNNDVIVTIQCRSGYDLMQFFCLTVPGPIGF